MALVTVIGVSTVVHFAIRYREYRPQLEPEHALRSSFMWGQPLLDHFNNGCWIRFVDGQPNSAGAEFWADDVPGNFSGVGCHHGLIAGAVLFGRASSDPMHAPGEDKVAKLLNWINAAVERHPWWFAVSGLAALSFLSVGTTKLESATDFTDNFHENSPIVQSYNFIAEKMGTTGGHDLMIDAPSIDDPEFDEFIERSVKYKKSC